MWRQNGDVKYTIIYLNNVDKEVTIKLSDLEFKLKK